MSDLSHYALMTAQKARAASRSLVSVTTLQKNAWLSRAAELLRSRSAELIAANQQDIEQAPSFGLSDAAIDRLRLTEPRIAAIADALLDVGALPDPVGEHEVDGEVLRVEAIHQASTWRATVFAVRKTSRSSGNAARPPRKKCKRLVRGRAGVAPERAKDAR